MTNHFWTGLILVQLSNISFAIGMVGYKRLMETRPMPQHNAFARFYVGAFLVAVVAPSMLGNAQKMPETSLQWGILLFLGVAASGIGYFMWNYGATGRCRYARHHEQYARARRAAGEPCHLANSAPLAELYYWRSGDHGLTMGPSTLGRSALRTNGKWSQA